MKLFMLYVLQCKVAKNQSGELKNGQRLMQLL